MVRVLVVDDEKSIRLTLGEFLKRAGYEAVLAEDAAVALVKLEQEKPDVVLSDIILPGMSGTELVFEIRRRAPTVKVVLMTGEPTAQTAAEAVRAGAVDYLMKPVSKHTVLNAVATAVHIRRLETERTELLTVNKRYAELLEQQMDERSAVIQQTSQRLQRILEQTMRAMGELVELRTPCYEGHHEMTAQLARAIAKTMRLDPSDMHRIYLAGIVHDVGMLYVPVEVLDKPGPLSDAERRLIQEHPQVAFTVLRNIEFEGDLATIALQHHERHDGSGYPRGLAGDAILLESAILAAADVAQAMTSVRPYRPAHSVDATLRELDGHSGTLYRPDVVNACISLIQDKRFLLA